MFVIVIALIYFYLPSLVKKPSNKWDILAHKIAHECGYNINFIVEENVANFSKLDVPAINLITKDTDNITITKNLLTELAILISNIHKIPFLTVNEKINLYMAKEYNFNPF
jgi:hypothetical protein